MLLPQQLDLLFPWICFAYGALMTVALNIEAVVRLADERLPSDLAAKWKSHRALALVCLFVGAGWILQNIWVA